MKAYRDVVERVFRDGVRKQNRTGVDTFSTFNVNYQVDLAHGFPLLTTKAMSWKNIVVENLWFLKGDSDISFLHKHGCRFWDPWAGANGRVPSAYGNFWRRFPTWDESEADDGIAHHDQINSVLNELIQNPYSRRLVVSAWSPGNAWNSKLPPCHTMFVFNVQNQTSDDRRLNLHLTQRSCDVALGLPYNLAGYAFILELFSHLAEMKAGLFAHSLVDAHIYTSKADGSMAEHDHVPGLEEQIQRTPRPLPRLVIDPQIRSFLDLDYFFDVATTAEILDAFKLEGYDPHPAINFKVAV